MISMAQPQVTIDHMAMPLSFGEFFRKLRIEIGYTLRQYCKTFGKDPAYISKLERDKINPPKSVDELGRLAYSLELEEESDAWYSFFTLAELSRSKILSEIVSDEEILAKLPVLLRTLKGEKLTEEQLDVLVEMVKRS